MKHGTSAEVTLSILYLKPAGGRPSAGVARCVVRTRTPPHGQRGQSAATELRRGHTPIYDGRGEGVLVVDLNAVIGRAGDVAPIKGDVCSRRETRICRWTNK